MQSMFALPDSAGEPPPMQVMRVATAHFTARALHVVAEAGVADHLDDAPRGAAEIAEDAKLNADALERLLRLLSMHGVFAPASGKWTHTDASRLLRADHPFSIRAMAIMMGDGANWGSLEKLKHTLKTGQTAGDLLHPKGVWGWYAEHPAEARMFDAAMTAKSHGDVAFLLSALDMTGVSVLADIGGGRGHFLRGVLEAHPSVKGVLFDQAEVVATAADHPRATKQAGDFFKGGLPQADLYLLTHIIHDWADKEALAILKNVRAAAPKGARIVLYELMTPEDAEPHPARMLDVVMLAVVSGRERTPSEYRALLEAAGWRDAGVARTPGMMALHCGVAA